MFSLKSHVLTIAMVLVMAGCGSPNKPPSNPPDATVPPTAGPTTTDKGGGGNGDGDAGAGEPAKWVVADQAGAKVRGANVSSLNRLGPGRYEVTFNADVSKCGYVATIGDPGNKLVYNPGLVFTAGGHGGANGVYVETKNLSGGLADYPFHLWVRCSNDDRWVVSDAAGNKVRGANVSSFTHSGPGQWEITFGSDVSKCAYVATIGDPANKLVYNPGLVFTAGGHDGANGVYIETKNLSGGLADYPWQMQVRCTGSAQWVVSDYNGAKMRGANVSSLNRLGPGRYEVTFNRDMGKCAYIATIGDPGNKLVYNPGLVFTASGHGGANGVYVETKTLSGGLADYPFHLNAVC